MVRNETALRVLDGALPLAGLALLLISATAVPLALPLAWTALGLAFFGWVAEADGLALPRPGRLPIRSYGCWETPLAFGAVLLWSPVLNPTRPPPSMLKLDKGEEDN